MAGTNLKDIYLMGLGKDLGINILKKFSSVATVENQYFRQRETT